ncbi:MAG: nuclear transport factor 2 family protein [Saprospiraceae bacterium]|nr:nuclear transport factor 2 family protein [Saprospiraceae bacterium]
MSNNLSTVQQIYACFGQGDIPSILNLLDEKVQWESWADNSAQNAGVPWIAARNGKAGAVEFFQCIGSQLQIKDFQVLSIMDGGNKIAAEFVIEAVVTATGKTYRDEEIHLWSFSEAGKVIGLRHYLDTAKHIEATK